MINRAVIKEKARQDILQTQPSAYLVTLVYLLIVYVVNLILTQLHEPMLDWFYWNAERIYYGLEPLLPEQIDALVIREVLSLIINLLLQVVAVGYMLYAVKVSRRQRAGYAELRGALPLWGKVLGITILQAILIALWSLLLVIPGIVAAYRYRMAYYVLLDHPEYGCLQCIRESKALMRGHKAELFVLDLSFLGWYLLCALTFGLLLIWRMPYFELTYANFYGQLLVRQAQANDWYGYTPPPGQNL